MSAWQWHSRSAHPAGCMPLVQPVCCCVCAHVQGRTYPHSIVHIDYAVDQPLTVQEGRTPTGGMAQYAVGMLRLCKWEASSECLAAKGPDVSGGRRQLVAWLCLDRAWHAAQGDVPCAQK